jgi:hypothetical protein
MEGRECKGYVRYSILFIAAWFHTLKTLKKLKQDSIHFRDRITGRIALKAGKVIVAIELLFKFFATEKIKFSNNY